MTLELLKPTEGAHLSDEDDVSPARRFQWGERECGPAQHAEVTLNAPVRLLEAVDLPAVVALNNAHAAELGLVDTGRLARLLEVAALASATGPSGDPDAFLLAFDDRTPAQGPNHARGAYDRRISPRGAERSRTR